MENSLTFFEVPDATKQYIDIDYLITGWKIRVLGLLLFITLLLLKPTYAFADTIPSLCKAPVSIDTISIKMEQKIARQKAILAAKQGSDTLLPTQAPEAIHQPSIIAAQNSNPSGGLNADILFDMVNNYRKTLGLPAFQKDDRSCQLAIARTPELYNEIWVTHTMHHGMYARNLPYWNTENIISMNTEQEAFHWWINEPVHRDAIVGNYAYSCMACSGNQCAEEFTNFEPK